MPPLILDVAVAHRAALLNMEQAAMQNAARRWLGVEQSLRTATEALALQMANGEEPVTAEQLMLSRRYRDLRVQINDELHRYARWMDNSITDGQRNMATMALEHSATAIQTVAMESQITVPWNRLPVAATNEMIGIAGNGSPLLDVLNDATAGAGDALGQRLVSGIALGKNPIEVARQAIRAGLGTSFTRMQAISRSEMLRTYRLSSLASYEASRVVGSYIRISARDDRVCAGCLLADGREYQINEGFDAHPQCLVGGTVVNSPTVLATSKRWYDGEVIEISTVNGNVLTITPNHPVLTDKGWIAAHLLQEGDNVISSLDGQRTITAVDPNDYSRPAVIEDVLESFARTSGMISLSVPSSPVDFHSDGMNGNVDIVRADSLLQDGRQTAVGQPSREQAFAIGGVGLGLLFADRAIAQLLESPLLAAGGDMHGSGEAGNFFRRALAHHQAIGVSLPTNGNASFKQAIADSGAGSAVSLSNGIFRHARAIQFDNVVDRQAHSFTPHHGNAGGIQPSANSSAAGVESGSEFYLGHAETAQVDEFVNGDTNHVISAGLPSFGCGHPALFDITTHQAAAFQFDGKQLGRSTPTLGGNAAVVSGDIIPDRILKVSRRHFSGHVYNLQTSTGWYIAEGIITHNCRCTLIPVLRNTPRTAYQTGPEWFTTQPEATQRSILGKGRYEAWRDGRASLDDLVTRQWDATWGGSLVPTLVRNLPR